MKVSCLGCCARHAPGLLEAIVRTTMYLTLLLFFVPVVADFQFPYEFGMIAMDYLDRFLSRNATFKKTKRGLQLVALTSFYLAVKLFQAGPVLSTEQMSSISGGTYSAQEVAAMENRILFSLNWQLHPPCAADFLRPFLAVLLQRSNKGIPWDNALFRTDVLDLSQRMLHVAVSDYFFCAHTLKSSEMAAAALINAIHFLLPKKSNIPRPTSHDLLQDLRECADLDHDLVALCQGRMWSMLRTSLRWNGGKRSNHNNNLCHAMKHHLLSQQQQQAPPSVRAAPSPCVDCFSDSQFATMSSSPIARAPLVTPKTSPQVVAAATAAAIYSTPCEGIIRDDAVFL